MESLHPTWPANRCRPFSMDRRILGYVQPIPRGLPIAAREAGEAGGRRPVPGKKGWNYPGLPSVNSAHVHWPWAKKRAAASLVYVQRLADDVAHHSPSSCPRSIPLGVGKQGSGIGSTRGCQRIDANCQPDTRKIRKPRVRAAPPYFGVATRSDPSRGP